MAKVPVTLNTLIADQYTETHTPDGVCHCAINDKAHIHTYNQQIHIIQLTDWIIRIGHNTYITLCDEDFHIMFRITWTRTKVRKNG